MSQDQPFIWKSSLDGPIICVESLGISKAGQTVLTRLMESQVWHQLSSSVVLWFRKGTMASALLDDRHFSFSQYAMVSFKLLPWCWSPEGVSLSRWVCVWVLQEEHLGASEVSSTNSIPAGFLQPEVVGTFLPGTETLCWGAWCWAGTPCSQDIPPEFFSSTYEYGTSLFCICAPSTSLDGCGFFNSVVVRLPFNSIYDGSEWWLFCILVVIRCVCVKRWGMSAYAAILTRRKQGFLSVWCTVKERLKYLIEEVRQHTKYTAVSGNPLIL